MDNKAKAGIGGAIAITLAGVAFIAGMEGKVNTPYQDIADVWTICYGSTGAHVGPRTPRQTDAQCTTMLREDLVRFERAVNRCTPGPKNQNQFDALTSLSFNIGETAYCNSTLARKFNAGDVQGASAEFPRWSYARVNGQRVQVRGLLRRRLAEQAMFNRPVKAAPEATQTGFGPGVYITPGTGKGLVQR